MANPRTVSDPYEGTAHLWAVPGVSNVTLGSRQLKAFLHATGGWVLASGDMWDVKSEHLGVGVHRVTLKPRP